MINNNSSVNVLIYGDKVKITNLLKLPSKEKRYEEVIETTEHGGISFFHKVIDNLCIDLKDKGIKLEIKEYKRDSKDDGLMLIWKPETQDKEDVKEIKVWRISEEIGQITKTTNKSSEELSNNEQDISNTKWDYLIIDDQNFGCANDLSTLIQKTLTKNDALSNLKHIFLRTSFYKDQCKLLDELIKNPKFSDKLTIISYFSEITSNKFLIHSNSSWEIILQDIIREKEEGIIRTYLNNINRLVVYFDGAGVAIINNKDNRNMTLYYDPNELNSTWFERKPGMTFGDITIIASTLFKKQLIEDYMKISISSFFPINMSIRMIREKHLTGRGSWSWSVKKDNHGFDKEGDSTILEVIKKCSSCSKCNLFEESEEDNHDENENHNLFNYKNCQDKFLFQTIPYSKYFIHETFLESSENRSLIEEFVGSGYEKWLQIGAQIILYGLDKTLKSIPKGIFGKYITYGHEEIEHLNNIKSLISTYSANYFDITPLTIAIFGAPGSGKSFTIKELARCVHTDIEIEIIEYNLSQVQNETEIYRMFHEIRNVSVSGKMPLIIWDEFDIGGIKWLKTFLEPIQDGKFSNEGIIFNIGKSIFVFCGGNYKSFFEFSREANNLKDKKGPDFVSRIRAYLDLFGLNRSFSSFDELFRFSSEYIYIIQRAVIIRTQLERYWHNILDERTKIARIDPYIIQAFLRTEKFYYGARSIETILKDCNLSKQSNFTVRAIPTQELTNTHVTPDFSDYIYGVDLDALEIAEKRHETWFKEKESQGYKFGKIRIDNEEKKEHPAYYERWSDLSDDTKNRNIRSLENFISNILSMGYIFENSKEITPKIELTQKEIEEILPELEHEYWLKEHFIKGWEEGNVVDESTLIHKNVKRYDKLSDNEKNLYKSIVKKSINVIKEQNLSIVKGYNLGKFLYIGLIGNDFSNNFSNSYIEELLSKIEAFTFKKIRILITINNFSLKLFCKILERYKDDKNYRIQLNIFLPYGKDIIHWVEILKRYKFIKDEVVEDISFLFDENITKVESLSDQFVNFANEKYLESFLSSEKFSNQQSETNEIVKQNLEELISKINSYIIRMSDLIFLQYTKKTNNLEKIINPLRDKIIDKDYSTFDIEELFTETEDKDNYRTVLLRKTIGNKYLIEKCDRQDIKVDNFAKII